jgi:hypothetical protein
MIPKAPEDRQACRALQELYRTRPVFSDTSSSSHRLQTRTTDDVCGEQKQAGADRRAHKGAPSGGQRRDPGSEGGGCGLDPWI